MSAVTLLPVVSEKAMALSESRNTYIFLVPLSANKIEIAAAVRKQFSVSPTAVTTLRAKGKTQQTLVQRGKRRIKGQRVTVKKALVTLAKGESIKLGEEKK
jgi:large subunit ribosomal protein L23